MELLEYFDKHAFMQKYLLTSLPIRAFSPPGIPFKCSSSTLSRSLSRIPTKHALRSSVTPFSLNFRSMSTEEPDAKRLKTDSAMSNGQRYPVIGTHNGHFHADEALAVYLLRLIPQYRKSTIVRTRDPEVLKTCDVVCDVGAVHDHKLFRYDHHQREFNATFPGRQTKLSSAGLVWMHYGKAVINQVTGIDENSSDAEILWNKIYDDLIEAFDANDNGISVYDPHSIRTAGLEKKFSDKGFSIASVVLRYNYAGVNSSEDKTKSQEEEDARFKKASVFVGEQFMLELQDKSRNWLPARALIKKAFEDRTQYDAKGRIVVIPQTADGGAPWADHLYSFEEESGMEGQVLYVLFAENGEKDSKWRMRAVSAGKDSFENRKGLPEAWRGVRDENLSEVAGIPGCVFVHASGFIGGNVTFEGALEMAKKAVEM